MNTGVAGLIVVVSVPMKVPEGEPAVKLVPDRATDCIVCPPVVTVTGALACAELDPFEQITVYVVVVVGETDVLPEVELPAPVEKLVPVQVIALVLDQVRVEDPPVIVIGLAVRLAVGTEVAVIVVVWPSGEFIAPAWVANMQTA